MYVTQRFFHAWNFGQIGKNFGNRFLQSFRKFCDSWWALWCLNNDAHQNEYHHGLWFEN
jgi:hypothetical protein